MSREELIKLTIENINQLSDESVKEVADYVRDLASKINDKGIENCIKTLVSTTKDYDFINDEEELYQVDDLKESYK